MRRGLLPFADVCASMGKGGGVDKSNLFANAHTVNAE